MFIYNLKAVAQKLRIDYAEVTSHISHMGELGASREELLKSYIKQFLPEKYKVGRGIVIDSDEHQSRQQDFIVYDAFNSPAALLMDSLQVLPIESIYCTIEVKSTLNKTELSKCVENIKSVRTLKPCVIHNLPIQPAVTNKTFGFVFAYTSDTSIESLLDNFYELNKNVDLNSQISMICILDKGLILRTYKSNIGQICITPKPNTILGFCKNSIETNFYLFYLLLMNALNNMVNLPPDLMTYAQKLGALNIQTIYPNQYMSEDGTYTIGDFSFDGVFIKHYPEFQKKLIKYQRGQMNKDELLGFYFTDIPHIAEMINRGEPTKITIGDKYTDVDMDKLNELYIKVHNRHRLSEDESAMYAQQSDKMHKQYILMCH